MKDNFSTASEAYARYRPSYPETFYQFILDLVQQKEKAWDCGTGNGQVAEQLVKDFNQVYATDISAAQIQEAFRHEKISYSVQAAEQTSFPDAYFDLVVVAQAIHWFDFEKFYAEVNRTLKPGGIIAVVGYNRPRVSAAVDRVVDDFYVNVVGPYWDKERKYVDEEYLTIPFPFHEIKTPVLNNHYQWSLDHFLGYLGTWSAVKHYQKKNNTNPVETLKPLLKTVWGPDEMKAIQFPLLLRVGRH